MPYSQIPIHSHIVLIILFVNLKALSPNVTKVGIVCQEGLDPGILSSAVNIRNKHSFILTTSNH